MDIYDFKVILEPDEMGGYVVTCRSLPGCYSQGETVEEARPFGERVTRRDNSGGPYASEIPRALAARFRLWSSVASGRPYVAARWR
jgi:hypothetical protein